MRSGTGTPEPHKENKLQVKWTTEALEKGEQQSVNIEKKFLLNVQKSSYFSELSIHLPALYEYKGYSFIISDSKYFK